MNDFLKNNWFLICLAVSLLFGFFGSGILAAVTEWQLLRNSLLFVVLFVMALPVATGDLGRAFASPWAAIYASLINFLMIPLLAWLGASFFDLFLGDGLIIAAAVPCTLASASVWTRRAGGNDSVAIFVTLVTNSLCFVLTPFWISVAMGGQTQISTVDLIWKLGLLVVLPMVLAQVIRQMGTVGNWSTRHKVPLSVFAQVGILVMVMIGAAKMGNKIADGSTVITLMGIVKVLLVVNAIHFFALFFGVWSARILGFHRNEQIAIGIAGSQKTLMVGLNTAVELERSILPMLLYHVCQLVFDTMIADRWRRQTEKMNQDSE